MMQDPERQTAAETRPAVLDRRGFLRASAGGAAAVALASALPAGCARSYPQAAADGHVLRALSDKEYAVARAAAEALLVGVPVAPAAVAAAIDDELAAAGEPVRGDMKSAFALLEHLTFLDGQPRRFTALPPARRLRVLRGWARSRFVLRRGAYQAVRGFVYYFAFIRDETRAITRFPGTWPERFTLPVPPVDFGEIA
jgi:hypothetical protein